MKLDFEFADISPNIHNLIVVTLMAIIGIAFAKYLVNRFPVKGLTEVITAV